LLAVMTVRWYNEIAYGDTAVVIHITVDGNVISTTESHPFYVPEKGWVKAGDLNIGDKLVLLDGSIVEIDNIEIEMLAEPIKVYNFEVEDNHTYYVGNDRVLVHNKCWGDFSAKIDDETLKMLKRYNLDKKYQQALKNGYATSRTGANGIIKLTDNEIITKGTYEYTYKLKVTSAGDHLRVYGRMDEDGSLIFDYIQKGK